MRMRMALVLLIYFMKMKNEKTLIEYTKTQRTIEIASIATFFIIFTLNIEKINQATVSKNLFFLLSAFFAGMIGSDLVSGVVHWAADTWGSPTWPIVGKSLIRSFREHHVDPLAITRHDFIETNGNNCLVSVPVLLTLYFMPINQRHHTFFFMQVTMLSLTFWIFLTNQFHKWSHQNENNTLITVLQNFHLILPRGHHGDHHDLPHMNSYCITTGWLNGPLDRLGFFRRLEGLITFLTKAEPRKSDLKNAEKDLRVLPLTL
jgi:hypothetical protein